MIARNESSTTHKTAKGIATAAVAAGLLTVSSFASAISVSINVVSYGSGTGNLAAAKSAQAAFHAGNSNIVVEDFEGFVPQGDEYTGATSFNTAVGEIVGLGGTGIGSTSISPHDHIFVRDGAVIDTSNNSNKPSGFRFNTTASGNFYLDSNDNGGFQLNLTNLSQSNRISFLATDIDDVGAPTFSIDTAGVTEVFDLSDILAGKLANGNLLLFTVSLFDLEVPPGTAQLELNIDRGDGFAIDDLTVSSVPLPAAAWLFGSAIVILAGFNSRKRRPKHQ